MFSVTRKLSDVFSRAKPDADDPLAVARWVRDQSGVPEDHLWGFDLFPRHTRAYFHARGWIGSETPEGVILSGEFHSHWAAREMF